MCCEVMFIVYLYKEANCVAMHRLRYSDCERRAIEIDVSGCDELKIWFNASNAGFDGSCSVYFYKYSKCIRYAFNGQEEVFDVSGFDKIKIEIDDL